MERKKPIAGNAAYRLPAEWEPQQAVMLTWPHRATDWAPYLADITMTMTEIVGAIAAREEAIIVIPTATDLPQEVRRMQNVTILELPSDDTWARDHGPIVLAPTPHSTGLGTKPLWLDFRFNGWGDKFPAEADNMLPRRMLETPRFASKYCYEDHQDFVLEGGSIESDGRGTIFTTSQCLLAPHRNQPLSRDGIEQELKKRLRADRIVWLDHGSLKGDDTDGHIDTIVRTAPDDTLLYAGCDDTGDEQYASLHALEQQLRTLHTAEGRPYRLLRLPTPAPIYEDQPTEGTARHRLPATYANFLILNGAVIVPTYGQPKADREALSTIQQAFPDREMIPIDATTIIRQHGSIHCLTMQIPKMTCSN